jgi:hypothetical protein
MNSAKLKMTKIETLSAAVVSARKEVTHELIKDTFPHGNAFVAFAADVGNR